MSLCTQRCYGRHNVSRKSVYRFYLMTRGLKKQKQNCPVCFLAVGPGPPPPPGKEILEPRMYSVILLNMARKTRQ